MLRLLGVFPNFDGSDRTIDNPDSGGKGLRKWSVSFLKRRFWCFCASLISGPPAAETQDALKRASTRSGADKIDDFGALTRLVAMYLEGQGT